MLSLVLSVSSSTTALSEPPEESWNAENSEYSVKHGFHAFSSPALHCTVLYCIIMIVKTQNYILPCQQNLSDNKMIPVETQQSNRKLAAHVYHTVEVHPVPLAHVFSPRSFLSLDGSFRKLGYLILGSL